MFLLRSSSFSREQRPLHAVCPLFPCSPILFLPPFTLPLTSSSNSLSFSPSFCLYSLSASLYVYLSLYPLVVTVSILESKHPRLKHSFYPFLLLSREGTLADAPDVSTVRLLLATDANGVVTTTDVALPPLSSTALLESDLRFSSPYTPLFLPSSGTERAQGVVVVVVVPSFAFKLD